MFHYITQFNKVCSFLLKGTLQCRHWRNWGELPTKFKVFSNVRNRERGRKRGNKERERGRERIVGEVKLRCVSCKIDILLSVCLFVFLSVAWLLCQIGDTLRRTVDVLRERGEIEKERDRDPFFNYNNASSPVL
jgi:hypothetical protein